MPDNNFFQNKQRAIEQLREMNKRAKQPNDQNKKNKISSPTQGINIEQDTLLILGLILVLANDECDNLLILALLYLLN